MQEVREATERVIEALKKSLMRHLFTYGPVPIDQADQVTVKTTPFGPVPCEWRRHTLGDCAHVQTGVRQ